MHGTWPSFFVLVTRHRSGIAGKENLSKKMHAQYCVLEIRGEGPTLTEKQDFT